MNFKNNAVQRPQMKEAPVCVQNAMLTKDKKPFTYTPGGLDLSEIKSERLAKRLERNANSNTEQPNLTKAPFPSPTSFTHNNVGVGKINVPVQAAVPPPPPLKNVLSLSANNSTKNSQKFEPPPIGFRPKIIIPQNPIASLKKVPTPVEKNTFWKDEYIKERSKTPTLAGDKEDGFLGNNYRLNENDNVIKRLEPKILTDTAAVESQRSLQHSEQTPPLCPKNPCAKTSHQIGQSEDSKYFQSQPKNISSNILQNVPGVPWRSNPNRNQETPKPQERDQMFDYDAGFVKSVGKSEEPTQMSQPVSGSQYSEQAPPLCPKNPYAKTSHKFGQSEDSKSFQSQPQNISSNLHQNVPEVPWRFHRYHDHQTMKPQERNQMHDYDTAFVTSLGKSEAPTHMSQPVSGSQHSEQAPPLCPKNPNAKTSHKFGQSEDSKSFQSHPQNMSSNLHQKVPEVPWRFGRYHDQQTIKPQERNQMHDYDTAFATSLGKSEAPTHMSQQVYIVPIVLEGASITSTPNSPNKVPPNQLNYRPGYFQNQRCLSPMRNGSTNIRGLASHPFQDCERKGNQFWLPESKDRPPSPTQSKSFKILQKITNTDKSGGPPDGPSSYKEVNIGKQLDHNNPVPPFQGYRNTQQYRDK